MGRHPLRGAASVVKNTPPGNSAGGRQGVNNTR